MIDKGLGPRGWEDVLDTAGEYIDIVKLGWGTSLRHAATSSRSSRLLRSRRRSSSAARSSRSSTRSGRLDEFKRWLAELGLTHVEISDGIVDIPRERKLELIADFARDFTVLSEVGSKDPDVVFAPYQWIAVDQGGARRRRLEGDHRGARGRHRRDLPHGRRHAHRPDRARSRTRSSSTTSSSRRRRSPRRRGSSSSFGPTVNLGNIPPDEVIPLETLRLGLRGDTLKEVLLGDAEPAAS